MLKIFPQIGSVIASVNHFTVSLALHKYIIIFFQIDSDIILLANWKISHNIILLLLLPFDAGDHIAGHVHELHIEWKNVSEGIGKHDHPSRVLEHVKPVAEKYDENYEVEEKWEIFEKSVSPEQIFLAPKLAVQHENVDHSCQECYAGDTIHDRNEEIIDVGGVSEGTIWGHEQSQADPVRHVDKVKWHNSYDVSFGSQFSCYYARLLLYSLQEEPPNDKNSGDEVPREKGAYEGAEWSLKYVKLLGCRIVRE